MLPCILSDQVKSQVLIGVAQAALPCVSELYLGKEKRNVVVLLAKTLRDAEQWAEDLIFFRKLREPDCDWTAMSLPFLTQLEEDDPRSYEIECDLLATLNCLQVRKNNAALPLLLLASTPEAILQKLPILEDWNDLSFVLKTGQRIGMEALEQKLVELGYDAEALCESPGQFSRRGGIMDIYPMQATSPLRFDFFGDEIESIARFDPSTQRSAGVETQATVTPKGSRFAAFQAMALLDYMPQSVHWLMHEPGELAADHTELFSKPETIKAPNPHWDDLLAKRKQTDDAWTAFSRIDAEMGIFGDRVPRTEFSTEDLRAYRSFPQETAFGLERFESEHGARLDFLQTLAAWEKEGDGIVVVYNNEGEQQRLNELLAEESTLDGFRPQFLYGSINQGFIFHAAAERKKQFPRFAFKRNLVIVTDSEIFGRYRQRVPQFNKRALVHHSQVDQLLDFSDLVDGDHVVHLSHGICRFRGLKNIESRGRSVEVVSLEFAAEKILHLPLHESHLLSRYVGLTRTVPKLGKLDGKTWQRIRLEAEKSTLDFAAELLRLQAERMVLPGIAFDKDHPWQHDFETSFLYKETPDQLQSIKDAKTDMESPHPMDRLICGDVGFGKTEVAIRAAFKAVMSGWQVAVIVPTTVLCQQHFNTFRERMADYPVVVEMISRFRSDGQQREILRQLADGSIDIIVGTHRLLSEDVIFKNLGLLIIDEEHRFGVKQKERIKQIRGNVDVLAMSATPIPRTLYLALVGARDLSVIETPPTNRRPIQTFVKKYAPDLVRQAIEFEIRRGGQVFYLHNRVQSIYRVAEMLETMLPLARIAVGHGQMEEGELEHIMTQFVAGAYDVLVCTTIIESGLDIPNSNTIIIEGADKFGLSQLYQLRGRVGRFKHQAYAYLLTHGSMRDIARNRLAAMKQHNQLGAGFKIALRDLELRGAGNLLGSAQSGHIAGIGFDLYCQLLRQSIARLKGQAGADQIRPILQIDFLIVGEGGQDAEEMKLNTSYEAIKFGEENHATVRMAAYIPRDYIEETRLRIDFYRQMAMAQDTETLEKLGEDLTDRFGKLPESVEAFLLYQQVRCVAAEKKIMLVRTEQGVLKCQRANKNRDYIQIGARFPRLISKTPMSQLKEIIAFLKRVEG